MKQSRGEMSHVMNLYGKCRYLSTFPHGATVFLLSRVKDHTQKHLWTSDQPVAETSTWLHTTLTTDRHPCPPAGFETIVPASERSQTHALDRAANMMGRNPSTGLERPFGLQEVKAPRISRHSARWGGEVIKPTHLYLQEISMVIVSITGWVIQYR
jgi:hypothetical protein